MTEIGDSKIETGSDLRRKAVTGVGWVTAAQFGKQLVQFAVAVVLARVLEPQDFGLVGMVAVFMGFVTVMSDMGLGAALIQRDSVEENHYSTIFWLNVIVGFVLAVAVAVGAPLVGAFYKESALVPLTRLMACNFVIGSIGVIHSSRLNREMNFSALAGVETAAVLVGGIVGIAIALNGGGVWSLVWQMLAGSVVTVVVLWSIMPWRPSLLFSSSALRDVVGYGRGFLGFNIVNYWLRNGDNLLIGKFIGKSGLGVYARAYNLMMLPLSQVTYAVGRVMFPALSRVQDDKPRSKRIYLRAVSMIALVTFPLMMLLLVVADHFVIAVFGAKWAEVIPLLRIFAMLGMVQSILSTIGWIYQAQAQTDALFRWGLVAGLVIISSFGVGIWIGTVKAVAVCYAVAGGVILFYPALALSGRFIGMKVAEVVGSVAGILGCAVIMAGVAWLAGLALPPQWPHWAFLLVQSAAGAASYLLLLHLFKVGSYVDVLGIVTERVRETRAARAAQS